ncbi:PLDc N-terminal domain-containing protein [Winogradskyella endarachnes]|uniref:PLDc N-terminal domain-containing protein n=1 Tax=Winogradskyella endarachnes TaxID=2681965 RepID=UPI001E614D09|nr:PLDc N-terminal domain-containing protein [Winogradskyella endarachnes]
MTYFGAIGPWQIITILFILLIGIAPTIVALIDILKSEFKGNNKLIWVLVVLLFNFFWCSYVLPDWKRTKNTSRTGE